VKFVRPLKKFIEIDFAVFTHGTVIEVVLLAVLHVLHLVIRTSFQSGICVIFHGSRRFLNICEEIVKHSFGLIGFVYLLLNLLKLLVKFAVSSTLILFRFRLIDFVEGFEFLGTDIVDNASEIFLKLTKLAFDPLFENLRVNNWVIQIDLLAALLKFLRNLFVVCAQANA